jgi:flagellar hook-length control protein FliK
MRVFVQDAEGGANSQTGAKRGADKATSSTENPKPNTPATADTSAPVCATNAASADASVAALVQGAAAQTIRGNLGSAVSGEQAALPPSVLSAGTASRALAGVDAGATAAVATAQGENQPLPVPSLVSNANASATGTVPSFASLFARPERSEGAMATGVTQDAIGKSALPSAGTLTELAPTTTLASLAVAPAHGAASGSGYAEVNIATRVGDLGFEQDISRQLVFLAKTGVQSAELSLQPSELGPVSVSIQMNGLQASLVISAGHAVTRAALQEALPHLSELFQNSGLQLTNAQVGDGSARNADQGPAQRHALVVNDPLGSSVGARATTISVDSTAGGRIVGSRLIDTFA